MKLRGVPPCSKRMWSAVLNNSKNLSLVTRGSHGVRLTGAMRRRMHGKSYPMRLWSSYQDKLQAGGVVGITTKIITSALISAAGDAACQVWIENRKIQWSTTPDADNGEVANKKPQEELLRFDVDRFAKFTFLGGALVAPVLHVWYGFLSRSIPGQTVVATVQRVSLDQGLFAPCFIATFFASLATLEGKTSKDLEAQLRDDWPSAVVNNWKLWIPAQCINLGVVPPHLQVLFSNFVAVIWNVYLSLVTHKTHHKAVTDTGEH